LELESNINLGDEGSVPSIKDLLNEHMRE